MADLTMSRATITPSPPLKSRVKSLLVRLGVAWMAVYALGASAAGTPLADPALSRLNPHAETVTAVADKLWEWAELGYLETQSSALLQDTLATAGFEISAGIGGIPTAFTASFGSGTPVIGIMGEFDALPGISQAAVPYAEALTNKSSGHACGHNLFGAGSLGAALAVKDWLQETGQPGTDHGLLTFADDFDFGLLGKEQPDTEQSEPVAHKFAQSTPLAGPRKSQTKRDKLSENLRISQRTLNFNPEERLTHEQGALEDENEETDQAKQGALGLQGRTNNEGDEEK